MRVRRLSFLHAAAVILTTAIPAAAQVASARLEGNISDPTGAAVASATVTAVNLRTQGNTATTSNAQGFYIFPSLPPSTYRVVVEAPGFRKAQIEAVELNVSAIATENVKLEVGSVSESVTVEATATRVQTADAQIGRAVTLRDIDTLPALGRGPLALAPFSPGVSMNPGDVSFSRINGTRQGSNNTKLDGIDANDAVVPRLGLSMTPINTDSVEEFRIITNGSKAEYGRNAGGQIELITRSGSNRWSGNLFEYLRNTQLNANQFFSNAAGVPRPKFVQNIYGGSVGGPIMKDKTFFFFNYQGRRTSQDQERNRTVLTSEARSGIFRWRSPGSTAINTYNIPANDPRGKGIDPKVKDLIGLSPLPNNFDIGDGLNSGGFRFNNPAGSQDDQLTFKADHNVWTGHRAFFRYSRQDTKSIDALNNADAVFPGRPQGRQGGIRWGYSIGSDWVIKPTLINEARFGYQSASVAFERPDRLPGPAIIPISYTNPILAAFAQGRNSPVYDFTNNTTWVKGKSTLKWGFTTRQTNQYGYNDAGIYPNIALSRANGNVPPSSIGPSTGISSADRQRFEELYNDLLGAASSVAVTYYSDLKTFQPPGTGRIRNLKFADYGAFFQNDFKLKPNLTINIGVRWELFASPQERDEYQGTLDKADQINTVSTISDFLIQRTSAWYKNDKNNFAPRAGFAWDVFKNGKLAVRGGYGMFYDRIIGATSSLVDGNTPGFAQGVNTFAQTDFPVGTRVSENLPLPAQPPAPVLLQPVTRQTSVVVFPTQVPTGYVHHINLGVQYEVVRNTVIDVGWVRTMGVKLFTWLDFNQFKTNGDFTTSFRELEAFRASGTAPSPNNTLVRIFGTPQAAVTAVGATTLQQGLLGTAADTVDRNYARYAAAGVSQFYLRNYPQFNQNILATPNGRSWYDSMQMTVRRVSGPVRFTVNYTFSKSLDNTSVDGNGFTAPIDNFNLNLNRGRGDFDRPHSANWSVIYALPFGKGQKYLSSSPGWVNQIVGGWELGTLGNWQSGTVFTVSSGRRTSASTSNTWANYTGDRNIGAVDRRGDGVYWLTAEQSAAFSFPAAGEIGSSGRNAFRGPRYFNADLSVVKRFRLPWERHAVTFRAEMYNLFNNVNFANPGTNIVVPQSFGRINATVGSARIMQMALRYDF